MKFAFALPISALSFVGGFSFYLGCSSSDSAAIATDAGHDAGGQIVYPPSDNDSGPSGPCDLTKPFQPPTVVVGLPQEASVVARVLTPDELTIYFTSRANPSIQGSEDLVVGTRPDRKSTFGNFHWLANINSPHEDRSPWVSANNTSLFFASDRNDAGFQVYLSGQWYTFDARHNKPRIGRILMATGRDAADVALSTSFGRMELVKFLVISDEVVAA